MSMFSVGASAAPTLMPDNLLPEPELLSDERENQTANLLVIPISQEIAPDFVLVGYDDTIRRIQEILSQRGSQRNVLLFGGEGVGKTALLHGLVQRKNANELSTHMYKRMFYRLNTSLLLHTDDVSEINRKFDQVLEEFGRYDVLVIEGFYTLITYLRARGANVVLIGLLEALRRKRIQVITTCNTREKTLVFNEIPEVHEFFAPEKLQEPNDADLLNILRGVHRVYEARYDISITDGALRACRDLTNKYRLGLEGWEQPGRALIVLDRSISRFSVRMNSQPDELCVLENEAERIEYEIASLTHNGGDHAVYEDADATRHAELCARLKVIQPQIEQMRDQWQRVTAPIQSLQADKAKYEDKRHNYITQRRKLQALRSDSAALAAKGKDASSVANEIAQLNEMVRLVAEEIRKIDDEIGKINLSEQRDHVVTEVHVAETFSEMTGVPMQQLTANERERVRKMPEILGSRVFGQGEAIQELCKAVSRARAGLSIEDTTPRGSFVFLGPSGVGKSELGKALAEFETGSEKNLIRIDMSEFMEKHSVSRLIGAPPGYAGYEAGGLLTNAVREHPKSVVMFDEIEKAHDDVFKILLQVLGDARLTDGAGETVHFNDTYVVLTSNIGTRYFLDEHLSYEEASANAMQEIQRFFAPEIRGRFDAVVCFRRLGPDLLENVAKKRVGAINRLLSGRNLSVRVGDDDMRAFCAMARDDSYGARAILKTLKRTLEARLASAILEQTNGGGTYYATYNQTDFDIRFEPAH